VIPGLIDLGQGPDIFDIGPIHIGWYGVGYVIGLAVLLFVTQREAVRRGIEAHHVTGAFFVTLVLAIAGGRLYHVIDQWGACDTGQPCYSQHLLNIVLPPYSGLGLFGGVAGAALGILIYTRRRGIPGWRALDSVIPGALFAQGIARWGNFFNQELYGPPTDAPWGIAIDCQHRIAPYDCATYPEASTGFHPLFFYESALDIAGGFLALWIGRRFAARLRDGDVASFWGIWYGSVRTVLELAFRGAYDWKLLGIFPTAAVVGIGLVAAGVLTIVWRHRRPRPAEPEIAQTTATSAVA
jgi:phosphatidylglycerol:prolipoprotein diacylglycerol transferase